MPMPRDMLFWRVLALFAFLFGSCSNSKNSSQSNPLKSIISEALHDSRVSNYLSPVHFSILRGVEKNLPVCENFFEYIYQRVNLEKINLKKHLVQFWDDSVSVCLAQFTETGNDNAAQTKIIVEQVVLPNHPFSVEIGEYFDVNQLSPSHYSQLDALFDLILKQIFARELLAVFKNADLPATQQQFRTLIHKFRRCMPL